MTDSRNFDILSRAWARERRSLHDKIDTQAECIHQLTAAAASPPASSVSMTFPLDLPIPFSGMRIWHHIYTQKNTIVSYTELISLFCVPSCEYPLRSLQSQISKIQRHLLKHKLCAKYGITNMSKTGYTAFDQRKAAP